ncbi:helix-turn-helix domain-containing protein [bacterium]|nr:helix-turn-helix domain-containing protein [bacterium]
MKLHEVNIFDLVQIKELENWLADVKKGAVTLIEISDVLKKIVEQARARALDYQAASYDAGILTIVEAANLLQVSRPTIYKLIRTGELPADCVLRIGERNVRLKKKALDEWLMNKRA